MTALAREIDDSCRDNGFLQVSRHGVPLGLCDRLLDAWAEPFDLPLDEKRRAVVADESATRGFSELGKEDLAYSTARESPPDLFETFDVGRIDARAAYYDRHRSFSAPNVWPEMLGRRGRQPADLPGAP